jgi:hypothetical protein
VTNKESDDASSDHSDSDESDLRNDLSAQTRELDDLKFSHRKPQCWGLEEEFLKLCIPGTTRLRRLPILRICCSAA